MFIREVRKKNKGSRKVFVYHRLIESYRTPKGPRQRVVLDLGKLALPKDQWKSLANRIEQIVAGQQILVPVSEHVEALAHHYADIIIKNSLSLSREHLSKEQNYQTVDVNALSQSDAKTVGPEYVALAAFNGLKIEPLFQKLGFSLFQIQLATLLIVGRLVHPGSERELKRWAGHNSGLGELLNADFSRIGNNALYRVSDLLLEYKKEIEAFLREQAQRTFSLQETIVLYDLTNTYFEGQADEHCAKARFARSKDKRNDCPVITLGLVLDAQGFVKGSRIFEGNVSEPGTLLEMVQSIHSETNSNLSLFSSRPTVVIDAGIATEENLGLLKENHFSYIVVSRTRPDGLAGETTVEVKEGVQAEVITRGGEVFLRCTSKAKAEKEKAIIQRASQKMEQALKAIKDGLTRKGGTKNYAKILERIGRIRERSSHVSQGYKIAVKEQEGKAVEITWSLDESKLGKPYDGSYYLRTDRLDLDPKDIWSLYTMLTNVEDAFRCLKSELGLRPIYHRNENRIEGHLFISVLAYHLLSFIQFHLRKAGYNHRWPAIRSMLASQVLVTTTLPKQEGGAIHIRGCTIPTFYQRDIYKALNLNPVPVPTQMTEQ